jgi:hypothetical protein
MAQPNVALWLTLVLAAGCVADKPIGPGQRCPCAPGWTCDLAAQVCVPIDAAVPMPDLGSDSPPASQACDKVSYPVRGFYGPNIFVPAATAFVSTDDPADVPYEVAADLVLGATVTIKMTMDEDTLNRHRDSRSDPLLGPYWGLSIDGQGWLTSAFDELTGQQIFQSQIGQFRPERRIVFFGTGQARIDYYECDSPTPTRTKIITWAPATAPSPGD